VCHRKTAIVTHWFGKGLRTIAGCSGPCTEIHEKILCKARRLRFGVTLGNSSLGWKRKKDQRLMTPWGFQVVESVKCGGNGPDLPADRISSVD
jgi:hypothetical protein